MSSSTQSPFRPSFKQGVWCSALLWWLSNLPFGGFALGWIALVPLLWSLDGCSRRTRFLVGWQCGIVTFAFVNWWIVLAVTRGATMIGVPSFVGTLLGVVGVLIIAVAHGLGIGVVALAWNTRWATSSTRSLLLPVFAAATWTTFDWARCSGVLAHSWGAPAFSQTSNLALLQSASVWGQHGLSFVCVWIASSGALWLSRAHDFRRTGFVLLGAKLLVLAALHGWGVWQLQRRFEGENLRVLLVQTAAQSGEGKMQSAFAQAYEETYEQTLRNRSEVDLVVWPETTFRVLKRRTPQSEHLNEYSNKHSNELSIGRDIDSLELRQIAELCRTRNVSILCGVDVWSDTWSDTRSGSRGDGQSHNGRSQQTRLNEAMLVSPDGTVTRSAKNHLVPFGERAPFTSVLPLLSNLAPTPAMQAGTPTPLTLKSKNVALGALICFESCFQEPSRSLSRNRETQSSSTRSVGSTGLKDARALFVLTNDEWFSGSEAPSQHMAMSQMRAVENRRWVAQAANGGYTFAIDSHGRVVARSRFGQVETLEAQIGLAPTS